jgi:hypothetical protein
VLGRLTPAELARVRYIDYSYWVELSNGSRLSADAANRIDAGRAGNWRLSPSFPERRSGGQAGRAFRAFILVGRRRDDLVCLEGHLPLTAYALAGFPVEIECLASRHRANDGAWGSLPAADGAAHALFGHVAPAHQRV